VFFALLALRIPTLFAPWLLLEMMNVILVGAVVSTWPESIRAYVSRDRSKLRDWT
jgi:hypothetical protein